MKLALGTMLSSLSLLAIGCLGSPVSHGDPSPPFPPFDMGFGVPTGPQPQFGPTVTATGTRFTIDEADLVLSATLVAVIVTD